MEKFWIICAVLLVAATVVERTNGFTNLQLQQPLHRRRTVHSSPGVQQLQANSLDISKYVETAKEMLLWEKIEEKANRPVLNLSLRDLSLEEMSEAAASSAKNIVEFEIDGEQWTETKIQLTNVGILSDGDDVDELLQQILQAAPQLLRFVWIQNRSSQPFGICWMRFNYHRHSAEEALP
eukprot:CAMPEP_0116012658 /NCGR_PEP_ID=MMETSP0321-20121206/5249_1 /TAXON_ID=163516 /ORGANISM="Leptocylindrus danicus var. danicus, Strain B650" /LENGTH=179 /DNA_ID=CAMNT_0003482033 /DNA_START=67 /DNA_END=603 /DNA_ORIENTATION=-